MAFAVERERIGRRQQLRVRLPRRRPPPRRPRAQPVVVSRAPSASADTPAGCRNIAPSPRRRSSRPPHRQEALLRGPGPLAEQFDLHRQLPELRRVVDVARRQSFKIELEASHGAPATEPVDLHARSRDASSDSPRRSRNTTSRFRLALHRPRRQGARPGRRPVGTDFALRAPSVRADPLPDHADHFSFALH